MVVFYKKIRSEGKKSTERKSDKYGMDKARWHQDVPVSYTHLRAHETGRNLVCRLLLEKKNGA